MNEIALDELETKYKKGILKAKEMMASSETPGAYLGYKAQGELMAMFLFEINQLRVQPKKIEDLLP